MYMMLKMLYARQVFDKMPTKFLVNSSLLTALDSHLVKAVSHSLLGVRQRALYR
ncbi:hypothetical protein HanPSC8_Chr11g0480601 [Helianthus annuus]|nr:hypothetical protein HanPSC8_Chr11g0480601 [Helianthus annuus]